MIKILNKRKNNTEKTSKTNFSGFQLKTILWTQNEDATIPPTYVINGNVSQYSSTEEQNEAYRFLNEFNGHFISQKYISKELFHSKSPESFKCFFNKKKGIVLMSLFLEKDKLGRRMPYMFFSETNKLKEAINGLKNNATLISRTCDNDELDSFFDLVKEEHDKKKTKNRLIVIVSTIVFIIIYLFLLNFKK